MEGNRASHVLCDRYRLDAVLGEGGMGVVYRGFDLAIERDVAVKLLRSDATTTAEDAQRLMREVRATARVKSAHSVALFDVGETEEGTPFVVMNLIEGESLEARLRRDRVMDVDRGVAMALQVCEALGAAHAVGIVHRDIKPANIMLSASASGDHVTVVDFGIAKRVDQATALTVAGALVGTVQYMAPEQIAGEPLDGRADQYALAATLLRALSGAPLFDGDAGIASVIHHQLLKAPVPLLERVPSAPPALDAALRRALEKKPTSRFPDIASFASALRSSLDARTAGGVSEWRAAPPAGRGRTFGQGSVMPLEESARDVKLELDARPVLPPFVLPVAFPATSRGEPSPASAAASRDRPAPVRPSAGGRFSVPPRDPDDDEVPEWLSPEIWKRVLGYSALALLLGRAFLSPYMTRQVVGWLVAGIVAGAVGLGGFAWKTRTRKDE